MTSAVDVARRKNITIPNPTIQELKAQGHYLIDQLVEAGVARDKVYQVLSIRMHVPEKQAHFGRMFTKARVYQAIGILEDMVQKRKVAMTVKQAKISKRVATRLVNQLSLAEQRKALERIQRERYLKSLPIHKKVLYLITRKS